MQYSQLLAVLAFLGFVPGAIWLAYAGHDAGYYPYSAVPIAFGLAFVVGIAALFAVLPRLRALER